MHCFGSSHVESDGKSAPHEAHEYNTLRTMVLIPVFIETTYQKQVRAESRETQHICCSVKLFLLSKHSWNWQNSACKLNMDALKLVGLAVLAQGLDICRLQTVPLMRGGSHQGNCPLDECQGLNPETVASRCLKSTPTGDVPLWLQAYMTAVSRPCPL